MTTADPAVAETLTVDLIKSTLANSGYLWDRTETSQGRFREACEALGEIVYEADIRMGGARPRNYQLPGAIDFHTDHPSAEIAAWHCLEVEPGGGAMQLVDLAPIADSLKPAERDALSRIGIADNAAWGGGAPIPLATPSDQGLRFHYVPWLQKFPRDEDARMALVNFERAVSEAIQTSVIEIDIAPGHCLFLDNHRIMHGRAAISNDSPRNLKRFWIRRDDGSSDPK